MRTALASLLLIWLGGISLCVGQVVERYPWLSDLDQARHLATLQDKPLLIVFRCEP